MSQNKEFFNKVYDILGKYKLIFGNNIATIDKLKKYFDSTDEDENSLYKYLYKEFLLSSIVLYYSLIQGLVEDIIKEFENYLLELDIYISEVNEKLFNQCYYINKDDLIKKFICRKNISISEIEIFKKNNSGNIQIGHKNTNNIGFKDILNIFDLIGLELDESKMQYVIFDNDDYNNFFLSENIGKFYTLPNKKKYEFYVELIKEIAEFRHKIVHGKKIEIENTYNLEDIYLKIYLFKKYFVEKFLEVLWKEIRNYIEEEKYLSD